MSEVGFVNMIPRVKGVMGELNNVREPAHEPEVEQPASIEIFSVGPLFREIDYRRLYEDIKRAPFYKHVPF